jgi:hypothetical protein
MSNHIDDSVIVDSVAFENLDKPDRGYAIRASYLAEPNDGDALIEIFKDGQPLREFLFPAYKIWNLAAHFSDIVDGEIEQSASGYEMAAWDGISGAAIIEFTPDAAE